MNVDNKNGDAQAIVDVVTRLSNPQTWSLPHPQRNGEFVQVAALPTATGFEVLSLKDLVDEYLDRPRQLQGTGTAETLQSFCSMVNYHKTVATKVFASLKNNVPRMEAVIDYHEGHGLGKGSVPSFCQHRIAYAFPVTHEFELWRNASQWRNQGAFAQFLDARRFDLIDPLDVEPVKEGSALYDVLWRAVPRDKRGDLDAQKATVFASPGDLMQLVESLSGHSKTKFAEVKTDRFGGLRATIEKEGRIDGDEKIPHLFLVQLAAFAGGSKLVLPARIRAKVENDKLMLAAELIASERVIEGAFVDAIEEVASATHCQVERGTPEA